ncbi:MAG: hypothetical protein DRI89_09195 [Bacteroidetes bacterium]|nr:MAG: hypothetical protein DRI89_09195 [Bacteroidota bacterium]
MKKKYESMSVAECSPVEDYVKEIYEERNPFLNSNTNFKKFSIKTLRASRNPAYKICLCVADGVENMFILEWGNIVDISKANKLYVNMFKENGKKMVQILHDKMNLKVVRGKLMER